MLVIDPHYNKYSKYPEFPVIAVLIDTIGIAFVGPMVTDGGVC